MPQKLQRLALTLGDPSGIGPEIAVKALQRLNEIPAAHITVLGSLSALEKAAKDLDLPLPHHERVRYAAIEKDKPGDVAYRAVEKSVTMIAEREVDALVTGPISKRHLREAGHEAHGHTEILEECARRAFKDSTVKSEMLFIYKKFRLLLLTRHIALHEVSRTLAEKGAIQKPLETLIAFLKDRLGCAKPRLALLGLNPHAGESGGSEERELFRPVMDALNTQGFATLEGPFAADGFFRGFDPQHSGYDALVANYHDQGLIPFKLLAGFDAVNVTLGLPFIRTSVSHGTAEAIVGQGLAREDSLMAALHMALELM